MHNMKFSIKHKHSNFFQRLFIDHLSTISLLIPRSFNETASTSEVL